MTIGDIKLTPLKTSTEKIEFFKEAKNNTFNSIMESLTKKSSDDDDDWRNMSDKEWDRLVKRVDDSTGLVDRGGTRKAGRTCLLCARRAKRIQMRAHHSYLGRTLLGKTELMDLRP